MTLKQYKILFVDDDEFIRKIYTDRMQASGFNITTAATAEKAQEHISSEEYDLISLDNILPDSTGLEVLKWIRTVKNMKLPVVIFSASGQESQMQQFIDAGATEYIQKDHIVPTEYVKKVLALLDNANHA